MDWPADDQPLWMKTRSSPLMSVRYPIEINDSPQILVRHHTPEQFRDLIVGQFEELLRQSAKQPLACGIALHTMIMGQPYRLRMLREALQHITSHPQKDKVWFTAVGDLRPLCRAAQGYDAAAGYFLNWNSGSFLSASLDAPASAILRPSSLMFRSS